MAVKAKVSESAPQSMTSPSIQEPKTGSPLLRAVPTVAFEEQNTARSFWNAAAVGGEVLYNTQAVPAPAKLCDPALRVSPVSFLMIM